MSELADKQQQKCALLLLAIWQGQAAFSPPILTCKEVYRWWNVMEEKVEPLSSVRHAPFGAQVCWTAYEEKVNAVSAVRHAPFGVNVCWTAHEKVTE